MSIASLIAILEERGVDAETILAAVKAVASDQAPARSAGAIRQARYRERLGVTGSEWTKISASIRARDGDFCAYCHETTGPFHVDHIIPLAAGGTNAATNLTVACRFCNSSKAGKTLSQWVAQ